MKNTGVTKGITNEKIFSLLLDMDEHITNIDEQIVEIKETMATKADLRNYATKNDLENMEERLLREIRPLHRAVDKDAKTIISHGKRITTLEKRVGVASR